MTIQLAVLILVILAFIGLYVLTNSAGDER